MAKKVVIRGGQKILGTLASGVGDPVLTKNTSTNDVTVVPAVDTSTFISKTLPQGQILIGNASNLASAVTPIGQVLINFNGVTSITSDSITNDQINSLAGIAYSKLNLTGSITNNDINSAAGIARTKLATGTLNRVLINNNFGVIAENSAITPNRLLLSNSSGLPIASNISDLVASYLDPTSSVQTQLNNRLLFSSAITPTEGDLIVYQSGSWNKFSRGASGQYLSSTVSGLAWVTTPNGVPTGGTALQYLRKIDGTDYNVQWASLTLSQVSDVTATAAQVNILANGFYDATSSVQTQLNNKLNNALAQNAIWVGNNANVPVQLPAGPNGFVLTSVSGTPQWQAASGGSAGTFAANVTFVLSGGKTFGKYSNGQTAAWTGLTAVQAITDAAIEYIRPAFTSFQISGQATSVEVGTTLTTPATFTWGIQVNSGTVANLDIRDVTASVNLLVNTPNDGTQSGVALGVIQLNSNLSQRTYRGVLHDTGVGGIDVNSSNFTITAYFLRFWGAVATSPTTSANVRALPSNAFQTAGNTFDLITGTSLTRFSVCLPPSVTITSVIDVGNLNLNITSQYVLVGTISVLDAGGTSRLYNKYEMVISSPYTTSTTHRITTS
jgi:hypothetical protein